jgi:hypothetical protein
MKTIILILLILPLTAIHSQELTVSIELNKTEFHKYNEDGNDSMFVIVKIKNVSEKAVLLRLANGLDVDYAGESGTGTGYCFRVYSTEKFENQVKPDYQRIPESFINILPGEEITQAGSFSVGWTCRGMPTRGDWNLELSYNRTITPEDNYCMFKSRYSDKYLKEPVEAWTGTLSSNSIEITFKRD